MKRGSFLFPAAQYPYSLKLATWIKCAESPSTKRISSKEKNNSVNSSSATERTLGFISDDQSWSWLTRHGIVSPGSRKYSTQISSISIPQRIPGPSQYPLHFNVHFNKIPRWGMRKSDLGKLLNITLHILLNAQRELGSLPSTHQSYVSATYIMVRISVFFLYSSFLVPNYTQHLPFYPFESTQFLVEFMSFWKAYDFVQPFPTSISIALVIWSLKTSVLCSGPVMVPVGTIHK